MSRREREETVAALTKRFSEVQGAIVVDYTGLSVEKINGLRRQVKEVGSEFKVAKNTLLKIATKDTNFATLHESFSGQTAVTFIDGDPAQAAKVLTRFLKDYKKGKPDPDFKIKAGILEKNLLSDQEIDQLGSLPSREVLLGQLLGMMAAPMTGFVSVLADVPRKFLRALSAIKEQKEA